MLKTLAKHNVCNYRWVTWNNILVQQLVKKSCSINPRLISRYTWINGFQFRKFYLLSDSCLFSCSSRHLTSGNYEIESTAQSDTNYFWKNYRDKLSFNRRCINKISSALNCHVSHAEVLITDHERLFVDEIDNTIDKINFLVEQNISRNFISEAIWILYFSKSDIELRLNEMKKWNLKESVFHDFLPFLKLPDAFFFKTSRNFIREIDTVPYGNRIIYLSKLLNCNLQMLVKKFLSHRYLLVREVSLIEASIRLFEGTNYIMSNFEAYYEVIINFRNYPRFKVVDSKVFASNDGEYGITKQELVEDTYALRYSVSAIRKRIEYVKEKGITDLKTWMVRCTQEILDKTIEKYSVEKYIKAPFETREEYLSDKLGIPIDLITIVTNQHPEFKKTNMKKLHDMINMLLAEGYSGTDIIYSSRIFYFSIDTIQERITQMKNLGVENPSLFIVMRGDSDYQEIIDRIRYLGMKDSTSEKI